MCLGRVVLRVVGALLIVVVAAFSAAAPALAAIAPAVEPGVLAVSAPLNVAGAEHRPDVARPPPQTTVAAFAYDNPSNFPDPAGGDAYWKVSSGPTGTVRIPQ